MGEAGMLYAMVIVIGGFLVAVAMVYTQLIKADWLLSFSITIFSFVSGILITSISSFGSSIITFLIIFFGIICVLTGVIYKVNEEIRHRFKNYLLSVIPLFMIFHYLFYYCIHWNIYLQHSTRTQFPIFQASSLYCIGFPFPAEGWFGENNSGIFHCESYKLIIDLTSYIFLAWVAYYFLIKKIDFNKKILRKTLFRYYSSFRLSFSIKFR